MTIGDVAMGGGGGGGGGGPVLLGELNSRGVKTARGGRWTARSVLNLKARMCQRPAARFTEAWWRRIAKAARASLSSARAGDPRRHPARAGHIGRHQVSRAHGRTGMLGHYALSLVATVIMLD